MQNADESLLTERGPLSIEKAKFMAFLIDWIIDKGPMKSRHAENEFKIRALEFGIAINGNVFNVVRNSLLKNGWIYKSKSEIGSTLLLNVNDEFMTAIKNISVLSAVKFCLYYEAEVDQEKKG